MRNSGAPKSYWPLVKLPCLCLIAATTAFAMTVLVAPYLSGKAMSSNDPSRQLIPPNQVWMESSHSQVVEDLPVGDDQPPLAMPGKPSSTSLKNCSVYKELSISYQSPYARLPS